MFFDQPASSYAVGTAQLLIDTAAAPVYTTLMSYIPYLHVFVPWEARPFRLNPIIPSYLNTSLWIGPVAAPMGDVYFNNNGSDSTLLWGWGAARTPDVSSSTRSNLVYQTDADYFSNGGQLLIGINVTSLPTSCLINCTYNQMSLTGMYTPATARYTPEGPIPDSAINYGLTPSINTSVAMRW